MKYKQMLFAIFVAILIFPTIIFGQRPNAPSLEIILSDHNPLQVSINGRLFKNVSRKINLRDLPSGRNYIEVFRYTQTQREEKPKKSIVFTGNIRLKKRTQYQAIVDVKDRKLILSDQNDLFNANTPRPSIPNLGAYTPPEENNLFEETADLKQQMHPSLKELGDKMNKMDKDEDRYRTAINYLRKKTNTVNDLKVISSWLLFDENRLRLFKSAYAQTTDKENFHSLREVFTNTIDQNEFMEFLNRQ